MGGRTGAVAHTYAYRGPIRLVIDARGFRAELHARGGFPYLVVVVMWERERFFSAG